MCSRSDSGSSRIGGARGSCSLPHATPRQETRQSGIIFFRSSPDMLEHLFDREQLGDQHLETVDFELQLPAPTIGVDLVGSVMPSRATIGYLRRLPSWPWRLNGFRQGRVVISWRWRKGAGEVLPGSAERKSGPFEKDDTGLVLPIVAVLRGTLDLVFIDLAGIRPGTKWRQEISDSLRDCDLDVLFWCTHSDGSCAAYIAAILVPTATNDRCRVVRCRAE
jgi:hypothetical protein